jgi:uroporphyrinogen-III synthase
MKPLAGRGIVITRPAAESTRLADLIRTAGGTPILFPGIEIVPVENTGPLLDLIDWLDRCDIAIFVSPSAVNAAFNLIEPRRTLPPTLKIAAVGAGCVRALKHRGVIDITAPTERFDSEALLELPLLQNVIGKRIVIFRGVGGRELLADTLTARGAQVEYAECYRRARPNLDPAPLFAAWEGGKLHAITATSSEVLHNLSEIIGTRGAAHFKRTPCFVSHPRIEEAARALGITQIVLTGQGDERLLQGLTNWFAVRN